MSGLRAQASHDTGERPEQHHTTLWLGELRVYAEYGLLDGLAIQAMVPLRLIDTRTRFTDFSGHEYALLDGENIHHRNEVLVGPGDPQLAAHAARAFGRVNVGARLGLSFPLGAVNQNPYRLGDLGLPHQHLQFGTGSFDPIASLDVTLPLGPLSFSLFGLTQVPLYAGRHGYQAGARIVGGATLVAPLGDATLRAGVLGYHEWAERWGGLVPLEDGNQGRFDLYATAGITVPFATDWTVAFDVRARAFGVVKNAQLDLPLVLEISLGRLFHLEDGAHEEPSPRVTDVVLQGEAVDLTPVPGKWTVFDFWAPWCEACKSLDRDLRELASTNPGVAVRRVNIVDFDSPIAVRELPGVSVLPHVRLLSPDGRLVLEESGPADALFEKVKGAIGPFTCAMHPGVTRPEPGACPTCGMPLQPSRFFTRPPVP